jgi:nickel transport protein
VNFIFKQLIVFILFFVFTAGISVAHRVVIFAWIEGNTVYTESQFPDGRKIGGATVKVFDDQKKLLLTGKTDDAGEFSFKIPEIPASTDMTLVLEAGMGHQGEWRLSHEEIQSARGASAPPTDSDKTAGDSLDPAAERVKPVVSSPTGETGLPDNEQVLARIIDVAVEKAMKKQIDDTLDDKLDEKLAPLLRMLARMQDPGPTVNDIFGGIGYILGLAGMAALFLSRKKK